MTTLYRRYIDGSNTIVPKREARGLLDLLLSGTSVERIRAEIGLGRERIPTLRYFDLLCLRLPLRIPARGPLKLRKNWNGRPLSILLETEIQQRLKAGWSYDRINKSCPVGISAIKAVARKNGLDAFHHKRGPGGRWRELEIKQQIEDESFRKAVPVVQA